MTWQRDSMSNEREVTTMKDESPLVEAVNVPRSHDALTVFRCALLGEIGRTNAQAEIMQAWARKHIPTIPHCSDEKYCRERGYVLEDVLKLLDDSVALAAKHN
jgi:hypothetical protein